MKTNKNKNSFKENLTLEQVLPVGSGSNNLFTVHANNSEAVVEKLKKRWNGVLKWKH